MMWSSMVYSTTTRLSFLTPFTLTKWKHLKHSRGSYTMLLELIQAPEELVESY